MPASLLADSFYYDAKVAVSQQRYDDALEYLDKNLQRDPENGNAIFYQGYVYERRGQKDQANDYYMAAVEKRMDAELREKAYWKVVLYFDAIADWEKLSEYTGKFLQIREFDHVLKLQEKAFLNASLAVPRIAETLATYRQMVAAEDYAAAIELLESRIRELPQPEYLRWQLAQLYMRREDYAMATPHLQSLQKRFPFKWEYGYKLAVCYYKIGKYQQSLSAIRTSRKANKEQGEKFLLYTKILEGKNYIAQGKYRRALAPLEQTESANAKSLAHQIDLGETYFFLQMYAKATRKAKLVYDQQRNVKKLQAWELRQRAFLLWYRMAHQSQSQYGLKQPANLRLMAARAIAKDLPKDVVPQQRISESIRSANQPDFYASLVLAGQSYVAEQEWEKAESTLALVHQNKKHLAKPQVKLYSLNYAQAVFRSRQDSQLSLQLLAKAENGPLAQYYRALCYANLRSTKKTIAALNTMWGGVKKKSTSNSAAATQNLRQQIDQETVFQTLAQEDPTFQDYLSSLSVADSG